MRIIWLRHGCTPLNKKKVYLGHTDDLLDEQGQEQAKNAASIIQNSFSIDLIFSSDLMRAYQTAFFLSEKVHVPSRSTPLLRELHFGKWEGKTYGELAKRESAHLWKWYEDPFHTSPPEGEALFHLGRRIDSFIQYLIKYYPTKTIVVVTHGGPIRWFLSKWIHGDISLFWSIDSLHNGEMRYTQMINNESFKLN